MTYIEGVDYFVRVVCLAYGVHGCVSQNPDATYNVYVNANDSAERQREAAEHEIKKHIERDDFSKSDVREIEDL